MLVTLPISIAAPMVYSLRSNSVVEMVVVTAAVVTVVATAVTSRAQTTLLVTSPSSIAVASSSLLRPEWEVMDVLFPVRVVLSQSFLLDRGQATKFQIQEPVVPDSGPSTAAMMTAATV